MPYSHIQGHKTEYINNGWQYSDTKEPITLTECNFGKGTWDETDWRDSKDGDEIIQKAQDNVDYSLLNSHKMLGIR